MVLSVYNNEVSKEDVHLIEDYKNGDNSAFNELFYRYKLPVFNYIKRMVKDKEVAEDIFQEVFFRVIKGLRHYKEKGKFCAWLFKIAHSLTMDYFRKKSVILTRQLTGKNLNPLANGQLENGDPSADGMDQELEKEEAISILNNAVEDLPLKEKTIFLLRQHTELTFKEIAGMLEIPLNTALSYMHNSIIKLRKVIKL